MSVMSIPLTPGRGHITMAKSLRYAIEITAESA